MYEVLYVEDGMTTINQLKKVLFDQKDKLADPHYDNIVFIVQDETSPVPGRTVPGSSDPVFPVRRLTLPKLISYINSQTETDFPVPCLESRLVSLSDGYLDFVFSDLPSGLNYDDIVSCRMTAVGSDGTFTTVFTWNNESPELSYSSWFLDVNMNTADFNPIGLIKYEDGNITVSCQGTGLTGDVSGWKAYMWVYKKTTLTI